MSLDQPVMRLPVKIAAMLHYTRTFLTHQYVIEKRKPGVPSISSCDIHSEV